MTTRNGQPIGMIWVHFNVAGQAIENFTEAANTKTHMDPRTVNTVASVNVKKANGQPQALVKVVAQASWVQTLPQGLQNLVVRIFTEADHDEAVAMVTDEAWTGPPVA